MRREWILKTDQMRGDMHWHHVLFIVVANGNSELQAVQRAASGALLV
jgi:hypothetical protein